MTSTEEVNQAMHGVNQLDFEMITTVDQAKNILHLLREALNDCVNLINSLEGNE